MRHPERHPIPSAPLWLPVLLLACIPAGLVVVAAEKVLKLFNRSKRT